MSDYEAFDWCEHAVVDARRQVAIIDLRPRLEKVSARGVRRLLKKPGSVQISPEEIDRRYSDGGWFVFVEDRRRQVALAVDTAVESDAFPLPNSCRGTAVEIARTLARTLKDARESGIPSDDRFDDILELQLSSGREVEISRKFTLECLSDAQFELSDGTKLENLVVLSMPDYIAPKRSVVHRF